MNKRLGAALLLTGGLWWAVPDAGYALELFGKHIFGDKKKVENVKNIPDPVFYSPTLDVREGNDDFQNFLASKSQLIARKDQPVSGFSGLVALAGADRAGLVAALYARAYYGGTVDILIGGQPFEEVAVNLKPATASNVRVNIKVQRGERFRFGRVAVAGGGDVDLAEYGLRAGEFANSSTILDAAEALQNAWREKGYPLAEVTDQNIVADHAKRLLDVELVFDRGAMASFGTPQIVGAKTVDEQVIIDQAAVPVGEPYSPGELEEIRKRLAKLQVFASINVETADSVSSDGSVPVIITVSERKHRVVGGGISWSNRNALGVEAYWGHRNLLGGAEKFRITAKLGRLGKSDKVDDLDYSLTMLFSKPGAFGPATRFDAELSAGHELPNAYERYWTRFEMSVANELDEQRSVEVGVNADFSETTDAFGTERHLVFGLPVSFTYDGRDNRVDPKSGFHANLFAEPAYDAFTGAAFITLKGVAATYYSLDAQGKYVLAGRISAGSILGANVASVPSERRFFGGGSGSVRGFTYQSVGPRAANNQPTGGLSHLYTSLEARIAINESFALVPFLDGGTVSSQTLPGSGDWRFGAGIGVRYKTPVGPLRLDVAVPLNPRNGDPGFAVYAGIGQTF